MMNKYKYMTHGEEIVQRADQHVKQIDARLQAKRKRLLHPSDRCIRVSMTISCCGGTALLIVGAGAAMSASTKVAISCCITGSIMLLNAGILQLKKNKS